MRKGFKVALVAVPLFVFGLVAILTLLFQGMSMDAQNRIQNIDGTQIVDAHVMGNNIRDVYVADAVNWSTYLASHSIGENTVDERKQWNDTFEPGQGVMAGWLALSLNQTLEQEYFTLDSTENCQLNLTSYNVTTWEWLQNRADARGMVNVSAEQSRMSVTCTAAGRTVARYYFNATVHPAAAGDRFFQLYWKLANFTLHSTSPPHGSPPPPFTLNQTLYDADLPENRSITLFYTAEYHSGEANSQGLVHGADDPGVPSSGTHAREELERIAENGVTLPVGDPRHPDRDDATVVEHYRNWLNSNYSDVAGKHDTDLTERQMDLSKTLDFDCAMTRGVEECFVDRVPQWTDITQSGRICYDWSSDGECQDAGWVIESNVTGTAEEAGFDLRMRDDRHHIPVDRMRSLVFWVNYTTHWFKTGVTSDTRTRFNTYNDPYNPPGFTGQCINHTQSESTRSNPYQDEEGTYNCVGGYEEPTGDSCPGNDGRKCREVTQTYGQTCKNDTFVYCGAEEDIVNATGYCEDERPDGPEWIPYDDFYFTTDPDSDTSYEYNPRSHTDPNAHTDWRDYGNEIPSAAPDGSLCDTDNSGSGDTCASTTASEGKAQCWRHEQDGSQPVMVDNDGDGLKDYEEVRGTQGNSYSTAYYSGWSASTNVEPRDQNGDGLADGYDTDIWGGDGPGGNTDEYQGSTTSPAESAVLDDKQEVDGWTITVNGNSESVDSNPNEPDTDSDSLTDWEEWRGCRSNEETDPDDADTDGDSIDDDEECTYTWDVSYTDEHSSHDHGYSNVHSNPAEDDTDSDGLLDNTEQDYTHPRRSDTDQDGAPDGPEENGWTVTLNTDSDADTEDACDYSSNEQDTFFGDPLDATDRDGEGLDDGGEYTNDDGTDPSDADTDGDNVDDDEDPAPLDCGECDGEPKNDDMSCDPYTSGDTCNHNGQPVCDGTDTECDYDEDPVKPTCPADGEEPTCTDSGWECQ